MIKRLFALLVLSLMAVFAISPTAMAAKPAPAPSTPLGIDVSWPQCGKRLPNDQAFAIVGVNGGLANTTNTCLKDQLVWGSKSKGGTIQAKLQLYVNTANPGGLNTESWPSNNTDPRGSVTQNPYGICDNSDSLACAWQYGWNRAVEDVHDRFAPAAALAGVSATPSAYIWWLDVETENTWKLSGTTFDYESNVAVLEGMTQYFEGLNAQVGLYSTGPQWSRIVGSAVTSASNLIGLDNWRPGGASLSTSKQACSAQPLTAQGRVVLTQFVSKNLDYNYSCI